MPLDDQTKADLRRSALGYVQRSTAASDVPGRIRDLRYNIDRIEGRTGRPAETREQNIFELEQLEKLALALDVPVDFPDEEERPEGETP